MRLLNINKISKGTLTYSSQLERYQFLIAFADTALSRWAKWASNSAQWLQCAFSEAEDVYYSAILNANFGESATVTLQCSSDNFGSIAEEHAFVKHGDHWIVRSDTALSYRYYRLAVTDASVTYPRISKWYLGGYTQMPGITDLSPGRKSSAVSDKTDSGQISGYKKIILEALTTSFDIVDDAEKTAIDAFFTEYDKVIPVLILLYEDSLSTKPPLYANLDSDLEWKKIMSNGYMHQLTMKWEECR